MYLHTVAVKSRHWTPKLRGKELQKIPKVKIGKG